ncbi:hypothetical protein PQ469_24385 [Mucilaginibacter sp. KACC 22773]|nr:hypothetical protein [Mucilaginibacter sp. KACC 22773]WDF81477.1 hypothetical protein PQ469_24385 [Mucilaginibacter sp. KACC 22773]
MRVNIVSPGPILTPRLKVENYIY